MKHAYEKPTLVMERFDFEDILTNSSIGSGDGATDTLDDPADEVGI